MFKDELFRWHVALVTAAVKIGDVETQQGAAQTALDLADRAPALPRQPTVGVVKADPSTLAWLRGLVSGPELKARGWRRRE